MIYTFYYRLDPESNDLSFKCCAGRLSSALKLFDRWRESYKPCCSMTLLPYYTVASESGKLSTRILPSKYMNKESFDD